MTIERWELIKNSIWGSSHTKWEGKIFEYYGSTSEEDILPDQRVLQDQLEDLIQIANVMKMYDAADAISRLIEEE